MLSPHFLFRKIYFILFLFNWKFERIVSKMKGRLKIIIIIIIHLWNFIVLHLEFHLHVRKGISKINITVQNKPRISLIKLFLSIFSFSSKKENNFWGPYFRTAVIFYFWPLLTPVKFYRFFGGSLLWGDRCFQNFTVFWSVAGFSAMQCKNNKSKTKQNKN